MSAITRVAIEQISSPEGITIDRPSLNRPYNIIVLPLADMPGDALVFVTDPESQGVPDAVILRNLLGLSEAEARIAHSLAEGLKLDEAAERSGVTVSTARTYLKQIFQKTGVNRQSELIRYILTSPALMIDEARSLPGEDL
jgi:DNA-binding CsgD family transcriptional regulator